MARGSKMGRKRSLSLTITHMYPVPTLVAGSDLVATLMEGVVDLSGFRERLHVQAPPIRLEPCVYVMAWHRRNDLRPDQRWLRECLVRIAAGS